MQLQAQEQDAAAPSVAPHPRGRLWRGMRALLRVPLFYKILIANAVLVLLGTLFGSTVTAAVVRDQPGPSWLGVAGLLAGIGIALTLLMNAVILRVALRPLDELESTAEAVQRGESERRAPVSPVADRELERLRRTFNQMLDTEAAQREHLRDVAARALGAAEEERKRIARELHDETAQLLAALLIRIRLLRNRLGDEAAGAQLEEMRGEIAQALEGVRRFARGLRPPALDELGLVPAIESHARALQDTSGLQVQVSADALPPLPPEVELATYRIVQEALSNALRHARATRVTVELRGAGDRLQASVRDDGRGFDPAAVSPEEGGGLGLFGMRERAGYVGGTVEVRSAPGQGSEVRADIPLLGPGASG